jgi:dienelactone hydrolase
MPPPATFRRAKWSRLAVDVTGVHVKAEVGSARAITIATQRGPVEARLYAVPGARAGVVMVGGVRGGFDSPARGLYDRLAADLVRARIAALRVRYRHPTELSEATHDVRAGVRVLVDSGITRIGLVGHSLGGAAVLGAARNAAAVATVVTLATQGAGVNAAASLTSQSLLAIHGVEDAVLPATCSLLAHRLARGPKSLRLLAHTGHALDEAADDVHAMVLDWLVSRLG